ncbi:MAG: type II secretion system F family protein [Acidobacteriaceae bacterium]
MPDFTYVARTQEGTTEKNTVNAANLRAVAEILRAKGMIPTSIKPVASGFNFKKKVSNFGGVKLIDKITFLKNLGVMIKSGLPVSRALGILSEQASNKKFSGIIADITKQVESGTSLADALGKYPDVFSAIFVSMVRVGESSGNLEADLKYLSEQMQRDYDMMSKAKGALTYPIIVAFALVIVGFLMFTFVLPKLTETFKDFDVKLPLVTRVIIAIVDVFAKYGVLIIPLFLLSIAGFWWWRKTPSGKVVVHKAVLYFPVFSDIVIKINTARFVRVLSSLLKSGMPIVDALEASADVVGNIYFKEAIKKAASKVRVGSPLASGFKKHPKLFSSLVVQMMEVGEESGTTDTVLAQVAEFYESEVDLKMKNLSSIIEPMIMCIVGVAVGFLAVGLITPIYSITQSIG